MDDRAITLPESFIRNYRMSPTARQLYLIYAVMGAYSKERGWVNKYEEPYIHVTEDLLAQKFGFYTNQLDRLHSELVGLNLIQSRDSSKVTGEYSLLVRNPEEFELDTYEPEMPRTIRRSKKTLMYQWRAFIRKMAKDVCKRLHPLTLHIYCDVLIPCVLAQQEPRELREFDLMDFNFLGFLQPNTISRVLDFMEIRVSGNDLKSCMRKLQEAGLVELAELDEEGVPSVLCGLGAHKNAWRDSSAGDYAFLISLPNRGEKDYSIFFSDPQEYSKLIEQVSKGVPKV